MPKWTGFNTPRLSQLRRVFGQTCKILLASFLASFAMLTFIPVMLHLKVGFGAVFSHFIHFHYIINTKHRSQIVDQKSVDNSRDYSVRLYDLHGRAKKRVVSFR